MPTTNKGLNQPVLGSTGWGTPLNENATILDLALGAFEIVAGTAGTVTLSTIQVQSMCLKSDTAAFTADVTFIVPSGVAGQWLVTNQSAPSAFSVIVKNAASATSVSVPNGQSRLVYSDGTKVIYSVDQATIATQAQAEAAIDNTTIMTPLRTSQQVQFSRATQAQAEAGSDNTTLMTPLRTSQAIIALAPTPTTANVLAANAGATVGAVGSYAYIYFPPSTAVNAGTTFAGSSLKYGGSYYQTNNSTWEPIKSTSTLSGTWRTMGQGWTTANPNVESYTLALRIS
jgi:hypothetical protein